MGELGQLCHKANANALAHKANANALVYKAKSKAITVTFTNSKTDYVCSAYDCFHKIDFSLAVAFAAGAGSVITRVDGKVTTLTVRITTAPATVTFSLLSTTGCSDTSEKPLSTDIKVSQADSDPLVLGGVTVPRSESGAAAKTVTLTVDEDKLITNLQ